MSLTGNRNQGNRSLLIWGLVLGTLVAGLVVAIRQSSSPQRGRHFRDDVSGVEIPARPTASRPSRATTPPVTETPTPAETAVTPPPVPTPANHTADVTPAVAVGPTSFKSRDGRITFRVPEPTDPEYADYQLMLQHRAYQTSAGERLKLPYDPEWRSMVTGRREAGPVSTPFTGGAHSLEALLEEVVASVQAKDVQRLHALRLDGKEYAEICWPEFPQSRPYVKIPVEEAWSMHSAKCFSGTEQALIEYGGRALALQSISVGTVEAYRNFKLHRGLKLEVRDLGSQEVFTWSWVKTVAERDGLYKIFTYAD